MPEIFEDVFAYVHPKGANCNVYAFKEGNSIDLIDSGINKMGVLRWLWREMRKDGLEPRHVREIYHCHVHPDHVDADRIFQKKATKHAGDVKIYYPAPDAHRFSEGFELIQSNFDILLFHFGVFPFPKMPISKFITTTLFKSFVSYNVPDNIHQLENNQRVTLGKRKAQVITTGGHTEGHSFLFFGDEDKFLANSDNGCLNEFTSDWRKSVDSIKLAATLEPHNLIGGHDPLKIGDKKASDDFKGQFRRYDNIMRPFLVRAAPGKIVNVSDCAYRRVSWLHRLGLVNFWAHMTVFCIFTYFQEKGLGKLDLNAKGEFIFQITEDHQKFDFFEYLQQRYLSRKSKLSKHREGSICEDIIQYFPAS